MHTQLGLHTRQAKHTTAAPLQSILGSADRLMHTLDCAGGNQAAGYVLVLLLSLMERNFCIRSTIAGGHLRILFSQSLSWYFEHPTVMLVQANAHSSCNAICQLAEETTA
jgi:hypothetical protein